jgi:hypothetical protein
LSKNTFIPVSFVKTKYRETALKEVFVPFESQEEILKENLKNKVLNKLSSKDVFEVTFSVVREDNFVRIDCSVECELDLANL